MNPQECLSQLRELCLDILAGPPSVTPASEMAALFELLDEWIMQGGSLPIEWHVAQALKLQYVPRRHPCHEEDF
jgi:hypothetical protein